MTSSIIVTATNDKYYRTLYQFLLSIKRHHIEKTTKILIYDLGLSQDQLTILKKNFKTPFFQFRNYKVTGDIQTFYWKPIIILTLLKEFNTPILWLDSGTVILKSLDPIFTQVKHTGLYTPNAGSGQFSDRLHPDTIKYLKIPPEFLKKRNRAGGYCSFDPKNNHVLDLVKEWTKLSQIPDCIAPKGASSKNHRYDQALLTYLLYHYESKGEFRLTTDELDISSIAPIPYTRTRNKVPNYMPIWADPLVRAYYWTYHYIDISLLQIKKYKKNLKYRI
jgi:hypothetical protein